LLRTYATPLRLDIKSSRIYLTCIVIVVSVAILSLYLIEVDFWLKFLLVLIVSWFSVHTCLINNKSKTIIWKLDNQWKVFDKEVYQASLLPGSIVFPWLTILNFKLDSGRSKSVMIFTDAISSEQFRQLRVRLKVSSEKLFKKDNKRMLN